MTYSATILADSPIAYWRLGEPSGATADNAEGTAALDGTYVGSPVLGTTGLLAGDANTAMGMNATGQYVTVPDQAALDFTTNFSVEAWVKFANDTNNAVINKGDDGWEFFRRQSDGTLRLGREGVANECYVSSTYVPLNTTLHIVATYAGSGTGKIYVNGVDRTVAGAGATFAANAQTLYIGGNYLGTYTLGSGSVIDEVAVYGSVLTGTKVTAHYAAGSALALAGVGAIASAEAVGLIRVGANSSYYATVLADTPAGYWRLGEDAGTTADNAEGTAALDGTYYNTPTLGQAGALSGDTNKAVSLSEGSSEYIAVPDNAALDFGNGPLSYECWFKVASATAAYLICKGVQAPAIRISAAGVLYGDSYEWSGAVHSSVTIADANWHHVVLTKSNAGVWLLYLDGADVTITDYTGITTVSTATNLFFASSSVPGNYFDGSLDEVAVYATVLTPGKVSAHYAAAAGTSAGPITGTGAIASREAFGLAFVGLPAAPETAYYIDPNGNDGYAGTIDAPWKTIVKFFSAQRPPGTTLYCRGGTYLDPPWAVAGRPLYGIPVQQGTALSPITIRNYPGEVPVFSGGSNSMVPFLSIAWGCSNIILDGLKFQDRTTYCQYVNVGGYDTDGVTYTTLDITIRNCTFIEDAPPTVPLSTPGHLVYGSGGVKGLLIEDCLFIGATTGYTGVLHAGVHLYGAGSNVPDWHKPPTTDFIVQRCVFVNFETHAAVYSDDGVHSMYGSILHNSYINCANDNWMWRHGALLFQDNATTRAFDGTWMFDPNDAHATTQNHNFFSQAFDGSYFLAPGATGIGNASDNTDAGARNRTMAISAQGIASGETFGSTTVTRAGTPTLDVALTSIPSAEAFGTVSVATVTPSGHPVVKVKINWAKKKDFSGESDDVTDYLSAKAQVTWQRGRSSDLSGEATGSASFALSNVNGRFNKGATYDLLPGLPVLITATRLGVAYPMFSGYIQRASWDTTGYIVNVTCYDHMKEFAESGPTPITMPHISASVRQYRASLLDASEHRNQNLCTNSSFALDTSVWDAAQYGGTLTRITDDHPTGSTSTTCGEWSGHAWSRLFMPMLVQPVQVGQVYTASIWMRWMSGNQSVQVGLAQDAGILDWAPTTVWLTSAWSRHLFRWVMTAGHDWTPYLRLVLFRGGETGTSGTIRVGDLMLTRGGRDIAFSATSSGRWSSMMSGSFETELTGWAEGWSNRIANNSFETSLTGWGNGFCGLRNQFTYLAGNATLTRPVTGGKFGSARMGIAHPSGDPSLPYDWVHCPIAGTFRAGRAVSFGGWVRCTSRTVSVVAVVGSESQDLNYARVSTSASYDWTEFRGTWTPAADVTDGCILLFVIGDRAMGEVTDVDGLWAYEAPQYGYTPGFVVPLSAPTSFAATASFALYGAKSLAVVTPAVTGAGVVFYPTATGIGFSSGSPYVVSMWIFATGAMRVGMAFGHANGWIDYYTTQTVYGWTQITVPFYAYPQSGYPSFLYVVQGGATAQTFYVDGVRMVPGLTDLGDPVPGTTVVEQPYWVLAPEPDPLVTNGTLPANSVADGLATLNAMSLTRHWVAPSLSSPYWKYVTQSRDMQAAAVSVETFIDGDYADFRSVERDRDGIVNVLEVRYSSTIPTNPPSGMVSYSAYYSDEASALLHGPRSETISAGESLYYQSAVPDIVGPAYLARRKNPLTRPQLDVKNRFPSQLQREVADLITVTCTRLGITSVEYSIQSLSTSITDGGSVWTTTYQLEENPL